PLFMGLLLASFFAAVMSSAGTYATTSSAMFVDYLWRRFVAPGRSQDSYLRVARFWAAASVVVAALSTLHVSTISQYAKLALNLLTLLRIPSSAAVLWRRSTRLGAWPALAGGSAAYVLVSLVTAARLDISWILAAERSFALTVFVSTGAA